MRDRFALRLTADPSAGQIAKIILVGKTKIPLHSALNISFSRAELKRKKCLFLVISFCCNFVTSLRSQGGERNAKRATHPAIKRPLARKAHLRADLVAIQLGINKARQQISPALLIDKLFDGDALAVMKCALEIARIHAVALRHFFERFSFAPLAFDKTHGPAHRRAPLFFSASTPFPVCTSE